jgi:hypothetical protein
VPAVPRGHLPGLHRHHHHALPGVVRAVGTEAGAAASLPPSFRIACCCRLPSCASSFSHPSDCSFDSPPRRSLQPPRILFCRWRPQVHRLPRRRGAQALCTAAAPWCIPACSVWVRVPPVFSCISPHLLIGPCARLLPPAHLQIAPEPGTAGHTDNFGTFCIPCAVGSLSLREGGQSAADVGAQTAAVYCDPWCAPAAGRCCRALLPTRAASPGSVASSPCWSTALTCPPCRPRAPCSPPGTWLPYQNAACEL